MESSGRHRVGRTVRVVITGVVVTLAVAAAPTAATSAPPPAEATGQPLPDLWFVELQSPPAADGTPLAVVRAEKAAFRARAAQAGVAFTERYAYDQLWNGLSVQSEPADAARLRGLEGVRSVVPVRALTAPPVDEVSPDLVAALSLTGADIARSELGYTGEGIRVAIIDSGIDYDHADLGGDGTPRSNSPVFPTPRVIAGKDFVGDAYNFNWSSPAYDPTPSPDPYPDDCRGHGTHVAGIVGANGGAVGVAPDVTFGAYRVLSCFGPTSSDVIVAALEQAYADGMHVVNMSLGDPFNGWRDALADASDRLVAKGVVVVASAGNSGVYGLYSTGGPSLGRKVISVASWDNTAAHEAMFTVSPDDRPIVYVPGDGVPPPPLSGSAPLARTGNPTVDADACAPLPAGSLSGAVALIRRGTCVFYDKARHAELAGATAVVLYNHSPGYIRPSVEPPGPSDPPVTIPVVFISRADGELIDGRIADGPTTMTWTDDVVEFPIPTAGQVSFWSSYGPTAELDLKPDVGAPGGGIRSTYLLERGAYRILSGTSMASPHVAGGIALLLQARPPTPAHAVAALLMNSADPFPWLLDPARGLDSVHHQGAGLLDIDDSVLATTRIEPAKLALGEGEAGPARRSLTVENSGPTAVTYDVSHEPALATAGSTFTPSFVPAHATMAATPTQVTVPAGGTAAVDVTITAPLLERGVYSGYLVFTPSDGSGPYRVPYLGFAGDYQAITVLEPGTAGLPRLARHVDFVSPANLTATFAFPDGTPTYTFQTTTVFGRPVVDAPVIAAHFAHPVKSVWVDVLRASDGKELGRAFQWQDLPRNGTPSEFFPFGWLGTTTRGRQTTVVPDGAYRLRFTVLKALGDRDNPAHTETWTSPVFVIDRP